MPLGRYDWKRTAEAMKIKSEFWSWVFYAVFRLHELAAVQMPEWRMLETTLQVLIVPTSCLPLNQSGNLILNILFNGLRLKSCLGLCGQK